MAKDIYNNTMEYLLYNKIKYLQNSFTLLKSHYGMTFMATSLKLVAALAQSIILIRLLGITGRGEIAAVLIWPDLLVTLGACGMPQAILFYAAKEEGEVNALYTNGLLLALGLGLISILILQVLLPVLMSAQRTELIAASQFFLIKIPLGILSDNQVSILRARLQMRTYNLLSLILPVGNLISIIGLHLAGTLTVATVLVSHLGLMIGLCLAGFYFMVRYRYLTRLVLEIQTIVLILNYGVRVYVGTIFATANLRLDQTLLVATTNPTQLGLYVTAVKIASITGILANIIYVVSVPRIARATQIDAQVKELTRVFQFQWSLNMLLKGLYALLLPLTVPLIFGTEAAAAIPVAFILLVASLFYDSKLVLIGASQAMDKPTMSSIAESIGFVVTITLLFVLLPVLGIIGAAIASLVAYAVGMFVILVGLRQAFPIKLSHMFSVRTGYSNLVTTILARPDISSKETLI